MNVHPSKSRGQPILFDGEIYLQTGFPAIAHFQGCVNLHMVRGSHFMLPKKFANSGAKADCLFQNPVVHNNVDGAVEAEAGQPKQA